MEENLKNEILNDIKNINSFDVPTILNKRKERLKTLVFLQRYKNNHTSLSFER